MKLYFSDFFEVSPQVIEEYGAFDISLINDLPLFIDPFLLFNSKKEEYQQLHTNILKYLYFLKDKSNTIKITDGLLKAWYQFPEVKQNWFGFCEDGNGGSGLGKEFAISLHENLQNIFNDFGNEKVTKGTHLEKLCLIKERVGKDNISDFTTNLIHGYLLKYTETFAEKYIDEKYLKEIAVRGANFNYEREVWETNRFKLPFINNDYVLLTPRDMLTKDETWISRFDLLNRFADIPPAISNVELREQINNYFYSMIPEKPTQRDKQEALSKTIKEYPELIDYYIKNKEDHGDTAEKISIDKVLFSINKYVKQFGELAKILSSSTNFYGFSGDTYEEAHQRLIFLKDVIENKDGYKIFYSNGIPIQKENDLQILYRLTWFASSSDVNREVNNGRGPVDFKISRGDSDKTLIEFKLASNTKLKRNLEKQVEIYQQANNTKKSIKVILYFSEIEYKKINTVLNDLSLIGNKDIVLIDARKDNKPSASTA
ncbi:hypothetical protein GCM10010912_46420 [Paenibacillus albidus]|uniref:Coiled-coil protein n=1 Tax=Paenibacillus albidus TaxID=2041023 RepID=A0A917FRC6_9BACL|nr:hypothetical protein [Paenibacillus albidus]GGF96243.1 hypothetical protein GCM10010912_46420 [Paenibacillus albidus]